MTTPTPTLSIILPARNEAVELRALLERIAELHPDAEILVVNDGSEDATAQVAKAAGARVLNHPYRMGNGAAVKSGARAARGDILVFMDADGQHDPGDIARRGLAAPRQKTRQDTHVAPRTPEAGSSTRLPIHDRSRSSAARSAGSSFSTTFQIVSMSRPR